MKRRTYITTILAASLAGCTTSKEITPQTPNGDGEASLAELRWDLEDRNILVRKLTYQQLSGKIVLKFNADNNRKTRIDIAHVAGAYSTHVSYGGKGDPLTATIYNQFDEAALQFKIERSWAEKHSSEDVSDTAYLSRVLETVQQQ